MTSASAGAPRTRNWVLAWCTRGCAGTQSAIQPLSSISGTTALMSIPASLPAIASCWLRRATPARCARRSAWKMSDLIRPARLARVPFVSRARRSLCRYALHWPRSLATCSSDGEHLARRDRELIRCGQALGCTAKPMRATAKPRKFLIKRSSDKLGNASGQLGRNLLFATLASGTARFPRSSPSWPASTERLPFLDRAVQDHYVLPSGKKGGTILFQRPHVNPIFRVEKLTWNGPGPPIFAAASKARMREFFQTKQPLRTHTCGLRKVCPQRDPPLSTMSSLRPN